MRLRTIQAKLTSLTIATTVVALASMAAAMGTYDWLRVRRALLEQVQLQTELLAHGCTAAVAFADAASAREALEVLRGIPDVEQAAVYDASSRLLAEYRADAALDGPPPPPQREDTTRLGDRELTSFHAIWLDGERIGGVAVRASTAALDRQMRHAGGTALLVVLGSLGIALVASRRLQRTITRPIQELTGTIARIAESRDHSLRAPVASADEVGLLASGFNGMLDALQGRDAELDRQRRTLEDTVAERTAQLALVNRRLEAELAERKRLHEQLTHAQKMEAVGRLAGGVAHDFNNILAVVSMYAGELVDTLPEGSEAREGAREIELATERAVALTRQLLAFSRKQVLNPVALDTGAVVTSIATMIARLIGAQIELAVRVAPGLGHVRMDPAQLEQVLVNLSVNARDAMPGGGRLAIEADDVEVGAGEVHGLAPGAYVRLRVADTGAGMDAATCARVFEPFFTTKPKGRGTGLGLAMAYGAVEGAGGRIAVESAVGRGTVFTLHLPRVPPDPPEEEEREEAGAAAGRGERILLVEDDTQVREAVARLLARSGYAVVQARDGEDALAQHERDGGAVELVLTDLVMPGMSGIALGSRLHERDPDLPVVYMSGYSEELVTERPLGPGEVFPKPIDPSAVLGRIRRLLDARAPGRAGAAA